MTAPLPEASSASALLELASAIESSRADLAAEAALRAMQGNVGTAEILGAAARASAARYDGTTQSALHGISALSAASRLASRVDGPVSSLAIVQAIHLAASERKLTTSMPAPAIISGEISHLGKSFLLAARSGDAAEAESLFLGLVEEGKDRRQLGDWLFRAAVEDAGDGGHKLISAVRTWEIGQAVRFRAARIILRPALQYLVQGERDPRAFETVLATLNRAWANVPELAAGGRALDDTGLARLATALAAATPDGCLDGLVGLLMEGYALSSVADGIALEAAKRALGTEGYSLDAAHSLLYADAARYVVSFTRTPDRAYAMFQAGLRVRSPAPHLPSVTVNAPGEGKPALAILEDDLEARRPKEAAARARLYLTAGHDPQALVKSLVHQASLDSSLSNGGHNLMLADSCISLYDRTRAPEALMVLAKMIAASPRDAAVAHVWSAVLGL